MVMEELPQRITDFHTELTVLVHKYEIDSDLNMQDQVISNYVVNVLHALENTVRWQRNLERKHAESPVSPSSNSNGSSNNRD